MYGASVVEANLNAVAQWVADEDVEGVHTFEVPDVVGMSDYTFGAKVVAEDLAATMVGRQWERGFTFPYPNPPGKLRQLGILAPLDLVRLRVVAGHLGRTLDPLLAKTVYSNRLANAGAAWRFVDSKRANRRMRRDAVRRLRENSWTLARTDIAQYYASIRRAVLDEFLARSGCHPLGIRILMAALTHYQDTCVIPGLPIGPEAFSLIGNAVLLPADKALEAGRFTYSRWSDDIWLYARSPHACEAALADLDAALAPLGLRLGREKTMIYPDTASSIAAINDALLTSLSRDADAPNGPEILHEVFDSMIAGHDDETVDEIGIKRFRWVLGTFLNLKDDHGVQALVDSPMTMNIDPRTAANYLRPWSHRARIRDGIMGQLSNPPQLRTAALDLHLLRLSSRLPGGRPEGAVFERIATDSDRPAPVRAWGWQGLRRTPLWKKTDAMEATVAESDPYLQRASSLTLKGASGRLFRKFLAHLESKSPDLRYTRRWLEAA